MLKRSEITYAQFEAFLVNCGYMVEKTAELHKTYVHKAANSIILIPNESPDEIVPKSIAAGAFRNMIDSNVTNQEVVDAFTQPATTILLPQNDVSRLQRKAIRQVNKNKERGSLTNRFFKNGEPVVIMSRN